APHAARLRSLAPRPALERDRLPLLEAAVPVALDGGEVHEHVARTLTLDEAEPFAAVEPLDGLARPVAGRERCADHRLGRRRQRLDRRSVEAGTLAQLALEPRHEPPLLGEDQRYDGAGG